MPFLHVAGVISPVGGLDDAFACEEGLTTVYNAVRWALSCDGLRMLAGWLALQCSRKAPAWYYLATEDDEAVGPESAGVDAGGLLQNHLTQETRGPGSEQDSVAEVPEGEP